MVASSINVDNLGWERGPEATIWIKKLRDKHPDIYHHSSRLAMLAEKIAVPLELSEEAAGQLTRGCFLHDIGKTAISRELIMQRDNFDEEQWKIIRSHPEIGAKMLESDPGFGPEIISIVRHHHERWDGKGYPDGLAGTNIPLGARVCAVLDAFDSMTSNKIYRRRISLSEARLELIRNANAQFDPDIVHAMMEISEQTLSIYSL
ncbi:HD-GYP domain-containing protein [Paenibacillus brevis]|uniref:HD-GYP domain-containing protein n=1 Tax=Paenibacillus brevis TaxID=2841508 RepID=UPI00201ACEFD|nr:HD domain-containing phosphohydrolase [Paenibacillus brevis]